MNEKPSNICQTCLSCDRLLFPMAKFETLLNNLNLQIYNVSIVLKYVLF